MLHVYSIFCYKLHCLKEFWEQQKQLQELRKKEQLEALKKKDKHEQSAVASTEVKQKLQVSLSYFIFTIHYK